MKTTTLKKSEFNKAWHLLDATDISVGRLASRVSLILKGKNKPQYSPNLPVGDGVIIINTDKVKFSGNKNTEKKWGTPIHLQLAFIKMESDFDWLAKPQRLKLFKVIPYKRPSSSFGYSQAVKGTWEQYKKENNKPLATRARFKDSVDFIGWYTNKSSQILKISKKDVFRQYIAYHEGWGNYKNYKSNNKIISLAKKVQTQSSKYKNQLIQ